MLIAALGMLTVTLLGHAAEKSGLHSKYQANTIRTRRVLSLFYLGCALIKLSEEPLITRGELRLCLEELRRKQHFVDPSVRSFFVGIPQGLTPYS